MRNFQFQPLLNLISLSQPITMQHTTNKLNFLPIPERNQRGEALVGWQSLLVDTIVGVSLA